MRWKGIPLESLPLGEGPWDYSTNFFIAKLLREYRMPWSVFEALPETDRALMVAEYLTSSRMRAKEEDEAAR